jgi:hypothetical protein
MNLSLMAAGMPWTGSQQSSDTALTLTSTDLALTLARGVVLERGFGKILRFSCQDLALSFRLAPIRPGGGNAPICMQSCEGHGLRYIPSSRQAHFGPTWERTAQSFLVD